MYILISLENNESIKVFPTTDLKSPDILQNETTRERKENNLEDFFNTSDSVSKNSKGEKVSTEISLEKRRISPQWINALLIVFFGAYIYFLSFMLFSLFNSIRFAFLQDEILKTCCYFRQTRSESVYPYAR